MHNVFVMQWSKSQRFIMVDPLSLHHVHLILANWIWTSNASQGKVKTIITHHHLLRWKTKGKASASSGLTYQRCEILRWFAASFNSMNMHAHHLRAAGGWSMIDSICNLTCEDRHRFAIVSCNRGTRTVVIAHGSRFFYPQATFKVNAFKIWGTCDVNFVGFFPGIFPSVAVVAIICIPSTNSQSVRRWRLS